jgi:hypothetical protein
VPVSGEGAAAALAAGVAVGGDTQQQDTQQQQGVQLDSAPIVQGWLPAGSAGWNSNQQQQQQQGIYQLPASGEAALSLQASFLQAGLAASSAMPADSAGAAAVPLILQPGAVSNAQGSLLGHQFATGGELLLLPPGLPGALNIAALPSVLHYAADGSLQPLAIHNAASGDGLQDGAVGASGVWGSRDVAGGGELGQHGDAVLLPDRAARAAAAAAARRHRKQVRLEACCVCG